MSSIAILWVPDSPAAGCWLYTLKKMGRKFFEKRPNSAFSSSKDKNETQHVVGQTGFTKLMKSVDVNVCTSLAALGDDGAQGVAHRESQIRTLVDGHTECAGDAFKGSQQVHGMCTEAREHGPNLKEESTHQLLIQLNVLL